MPSEKGEGEEARGSKDKAARYIRGEVCWGGDERAPSMSFCWFFFSPFTVTIVENCWHNVWQFKDELLIVENNNNWTGARSARSG